jgi:hypothetical protein
MLRNIPEERRSHHVSSVGTSMTEEHAASASTLKMVAVYSFKMLVSTVLKVQNIIQAWFMYFHILLSALIK